MSACIAAACLFYLAFLLREKISAQKNRKSIAHVIHVNGIRGKSSVCRLIDAGLRAGGFSVFTKTTGTSPAVIHTDGTEHPLHRRGRPSIKEQLSVLKKAAAQKAGVLVIECMAVEPEYQKISEERMLKSDIGVITNVRPDHPEEMGNTLAQVAEALAGTIPRGGTLFTADPEFFGFFSEKAMKMGTRTIPAPAPPEDFGSIDFADNVSLAAAVCGHLGIPWDVAVRAMKNYRKDPGAFSVEKKTGSNGRSLVFLNALAANDPASTEKILDMAEAKGLFDAGRKVLLVNNRYDRPARTRQFIDFALKHEKRFDGIIFSGSCRRLSRRALVKKGIKADRILLLGKLSELDGQESGTVVFAVGNIVGTGRESPGKSRKEGQAIVR